MLVRLFVALSADAPIASTPLINKPIAANMPAVKAAAPSGLKRKFLATAAANKAFLRVLTVLTIASKETIKAAILLIVKAAIKRAAKDLIKTMFSLIASPIVIKALEADSPKLIILVCNWSMSVAPLIRIMASTSPAPILSLAESAATFNLASLPAKVLAAAEAAPFVTSVTSLRILAKSPEARVVLLMPKPNAPKLLVLPK